MKAIFLSIAFTTLLLPLEFSRKNDLVAKLHTKDTSETKSYAGRVVQGITSYDGYWVTTQTAEDKFLVVNFLDQNGVSEYNERIMYPSHGQDLSIEYNEAQRLLYLYTTSTQRNGIARIAYSLDGLLPKLISVDEYDLKCKRCTPTISEDKNYFAVKDKKEILIYDKNKIVENKTKEALLYRFKLDERQTKKGLWFQGIAMKDNLVYCLSSDSALESEKLLFVYDLSGKVVFHTKLEAGKQEALKEGKKYEFEGLTFKGNALYTTVMSGKSGRNIKRLYKILEVTQ